MTRLAFRSLLMSYVALALFMHSMTTPPSSSYPRYFFNSQRTQVIVDPLPSGLSKVVIFIHGTFFPLGSALIDHFDIPLGFIASSRATIGKPGSMARIKQALLEADVIQSEEGLFFFG